MRRAAVVGASVPDHGNRSRTALGPPARGQRAPVEVTVVMEPTRNAWVPLAAWFRRKGANVVLVSAQRSADLRAYYAKHTKSDRLDSVLLARLPLLHPEGLHPEHGLGPGDPLRRATSCTPPWSRVAPAWPDSMPCWRSWVPTGMPPWAGTWQRRPRCGSLPPAMPTPTRSSDWAEHAWPGSSTGTPAAPGEKPRPTPSSPPQRQRSLCGPRSWRSRTWPKTSRWRLGSP